VTDSGSELINSLENKVVPNGIQASKIFYKKSKQWKVGDVLKLQKSPGPGPVSLKPALPVKITNIPVKSQALPVISPPQDSQTNSNSSSINLNRQENDVVRTNVNPNANINLNYDNFNYNQNDNSQAPSPIVSPVVNFKRQVTIKNIKTELAKRGYKLPPYEVDDAIETASEIFGQDADLNTLLELTIQTIDARLAEKNINSNSINENSNAFPDIVDDLLGDIVVDDKPIVPNKPIVPDPVESLAARKQRIFDILLSHGHSEESIQTKVMKLTYLFSSNYSIERAIAEATSALEE
jgi:hypothetical protein